MIENHLELATGTTATNSRIRISLTYTENWYILNHRLA
jgi:hypothetical protein